MSGFSRERRMCIAHGIAAEAAPTRDFEKLTNRVIPAKAGIHFAFRDSNMDPCVTSPSAVEKLLAGMTNKKAVIRGFHESQGG